MTWKEPPLFDMPATHRKEPAGIVGVELTFSVMVQFDLDDPDGIMRWANESGIDVYAEDDFKDASRLNAMLIAAGYQKWVVGAGVGSEEFEEAMVYPPKGLATCAQIVDRLASPRWIPIEEPS